MLSWKKKLIEDIKHINKGKPLIFIHTPKCGGTFFRQVCEEFNIIYKGHKQAIEGEGINFTIIRNPVERFESLLNYRLGGKPRRDWPKHLQYVYQDSRSSRSSRSSMSVYAEDWTRTSLNEIINKMSDKEMTSFEPYVSLTYWALNIDVFITMDEVKTFLEIFGHTYDESKFYKKNVSKKNRGKLNDFNKNRIAKLYNEDMKLFNKWTT